MSVKRGDSILRVCQQHLLSQVDPACNTEWKEMWGHVREREQGGEERWKERTASKVGDIKQR